MSFRTQQFKNTSSIRRPTKLEHIAAGEALNKQTEQMAIDSARQRAYEYGMRLYLMSKGVKFGKTLPSAPYFNRDGVQIPALSYEEAIQLHESSRCKTKEEMRAMCA